MRKAALAIATKQERKKTARKRHRDRGDHYPLAHFRERIRLARPGEQTVLLRRRAGKNREPGRGKRAPAFAPARKPGHNLIQYRAAA